MCNKNKFTLSPLSVKLSKVAEAGRVLAVLLFLCTAMATWAESTVTFSTSDISNNSDKSFTKSDVTLTTTSNNEKSNGFKITSSSTMTLSTTSGNITKVVLTYNTYGSGVSASTGTVTGTGPQTWTGTATTITFSATDNCKISNVEVTLDGTSGGGDDKGDTGDTEPVASNDVFKISKDNASNVTQNNTLWNETKTMRVTLGGWLFPNNVTPNNGTTTETLGDGEWSNASQVTKTEDKLDGFDYLASGDKSKNARQENGANAMPVSTKVYDGSKEEVTSVQLLDPMFNVPCAGSYLVVETRSLGTATVYINQNGVFDKSGDKIQYRPQRRVFVLDEAGNAISTTAKIGNENGTPNGGYTLSDYSWDWGGTDNATPTVEMVKKHFNLTEFTMSKDGFKNGVYANCLTYDECSNEYLNGKSYDEIKNMDAGLRGWSVLADAPVAYTFDTKPGKTYYVYNYGSKIGLYGFAFTSKTATVDEVSYSETSTPSISKTEDGHVAKVSIDREFKAGIWNAAVLPFSLHKQQIDAIFGTTYSKGNENGTQILYFDHTEGSTIYFTRHAYNTIVAGKPFLIKPTQDAKINTASVTDFPYVTIESTEGESFGKDKATASYSWFSSYAGQTIAAGDYFLRDAEANSKVADGKIVRLPVNYSGTFTINGFRGYLKAKDESTRTNAKTMTIAYNTFDSDETTYIGTVTLNPDGTLTPALAGNVYNLQGQLVSTDASQLSSLPKGIYVVNGNKVSVK